MAFLKKQMSNNIDDYQVKILIFASNSIFDLSADKIKESTITSKYNKL